ncbi:MAG TPA: hypothetical protein VEH08_04225, partial [Methanomassiliicoccales archaeon]|nr:hypothetical protein [Methanomassiliicoccales archaeon]
MSFKNELTYLHEVEDNAEERFDDTYYTAINLVMEDFEKEEVLPNIIAGKRTRSKATFEKRSPA